ncbi:hypothetical protein [Neotabrizicola sp. sgz301269]|uniref:hypothetical protein n=1 Tax=Neotabrizicola sp. sgz301269 TaxID=3276282 RepID=UPI00376F598E
MRRLLGGLALGALLASPAAAETDCKALWGALATELPEGLILAGRPANPQDGFCVLTGIEMSYGAEARSVLVLDRLLVKGTALDAFLGADTAPTGLEARIEGLRLLTRTGIASFDYASAAQARLARTNASFLLSWDDKAKLLRLERLNVDLPGNNAISLKAEVQAVDLSSRAAIQTSLTSFALTRADLDMTLHGFFEWYLLPALAASFLPNEGDAEAAAKDAKATAKAFIETLPEPTFPTATRDAAARIVDEMPNPSGRLKLSFDAPEGFGPVRFARYALTGMPTTLQAAAPLFQGVTLGLSWTHEDAE